MRGDERAGEIECLPNRLRTQNFDQTHADLMTWSTVALLSSFYIVG